MLVPIPRRSMLLRLLRRLLHRRLLFRLRRRYRSAYSPRSMARPSYQRILPALPPSPTSRRSHACKYHSQQGADFPRAIIFQERLFLQMLINGARRLLHAFGRPTLAAGLPAPVVHHAKALLRGGIQVLGGPCARVAPVRCDCLAGRSGIKVLNVAVLRQPLINPLPVCF